MRYNASPGLIPHLPASYSPSGLATSRPPEGSSTTGTAIVRTPVRGS